MQGAAGKRPMAKEKIRNEGADDRCYADLQFVNSKF
jgi:hypothetical protein